MFLARHLFSAKYWFNLGGQETSRHGCKNVGSNAKHQYKEPKSTQNNKRDTHLYLFAAVVCVYWYTGLPLVCYMKIFAFKMFSMKIFFRTLFVWQENDLGV